MTTRRQFLATAGVAGMAAVVPEGKAAHTVTKELDRAQSNPASVKSVAKFQPEPMTAPEMALSNTFSLGKSTINEGEVISAGRWGIFYVNVQGGKITHLRPFEHDYAPSINLNGYGQLPYSRARIRHPYVREGFLKEGPKSKAKRGDEKFVRVSWETALDLAAKHIDQVYDNYGPSAVWGHSYGWQSTGRVNSAMYVVNRLLRLRGGYIEAQNNYSNAAIRRILNYVVGTGDARSTSWEMVVKHSQRVVFWGADPIVTNDIDWYTTLHNGAGYLRALKEKGTKTYAVNPLYPDTGAFLGSEWIAPRPGTDPAMMLGMMHELLKSKKADMAFLKTYTAGYQELIDYILGKEDGIEKTPEWAAKQCGVPAEKIRAFVHDLADNRTMIMMGWGIQRIQFGEQPHWMGWALCAMLGQIGLPGGGIGTNYQYSNGGTPMANGPFLAGLSASPKPVKVSDKPWKGSKQMPVARFPDCFLNPGKTIDFDGKKVTYPDVRLVFWGGGNPFGHQPQTFQVEEAFKRPDCVICSDIVWTATARHADIVFPACTTFEHNDISNIGTYSNDGIVAMKKAIEPQWESKTDFWIADQLARRMGMGDAFSEGLTEEEWIEKLYNQSRDFGAKMGIDLPDFKTFWEKGYVLFDVDQKSRDYVAFADFRADPKAHALSTESGLIQLFSPKVAGYGYPDCKGHAMYFPPKEGVGAATKEFPLAYVCCKSRYRLHSQLDSTPSHNLADIDSREPCWIHPKDAKVRGIVQGDLVMVSSRRGKLMAAAYITERTQPGVVVVHHGAWFDPQTTENGRVDVHGNANSLTMDVPTSRLAQGNVASTGNVQVEKWTAELPDVAIWEQPKIVNR